MWYSVGDTAMNNGSRRAGKILDELDYTWSESPMPEAADWIDRYVQLRE